MVIITNSSGIEQGAFVSGHGLRFASSVEMANTSPGLIKHLFLPCGYPGKHRVKLFHDGEWTVVEVDDRIPCRRRIGAAQDDAEAKPVFLAAKKVREVWPMLLEKACAKLHGTYEATMRPLAASATACL